ncbi:helix-turn-helix domain-containing protein [Marinilabilia salmonicolor]|uniref:helix-turn-helix domain-containing protein n=1 Tax=Marinilabilia salmonicolor TaxID=989 RepID=UPI00029B2AE5|nr:helix-turn-helix domain-containing protein [Marinilabilia salmonicolor]
MASEIITLEDLQDFRAELINDIRRIIKETSGQPTKKWLKSYEVREILNISPGTLQNLRINGTLPYTKIGGVMYYDYTDIQNVLERNKSTSF